MKLFTVVTTLTRAIVLAALAALAFACVQPADNTAPNNDTPQTIYYTVSFNAHGGIPAPQSQQTAKGQIVTPPPPP
jgi:hypothetical protein